MANKRDIKKNIRSLCGSLAAELLCAAECIEGFDTGKVNDIVARIAQLQVNALANCSFSFDKTRKDFDSPKAYNAALSSYNHAAFARLQADVEAEVAGILKEMNALLPQAVRDAVKKSAE